MTSDEKVSYRYALYYKEYTLISPDLPTLLNMQREYETERPQEKPIIFEAERTEYSQRCQSDPDQTVIENFKWEDQ